MLAHFNTSCCCVNMGTLKNLFALLLIFGLIDFLTATETRKSRLRYKDINCKNYNRTRKPYDLIIEDELDFDAEPEPLNFIMEKIELNREKIKMSLCELKTHFEKDIHMAEVEADTFNNDRLEQLDGTVTSRKVGSVLRNTVLKVGECVSSLAKKVLILPMKVKPEVPCVTKELLLLKNYSTDIAQIVTEALKSIVHYPRHMAICFKTENKINCLSKLHKKVIRNTIADIMATVEKSVQMDKILLILNNREKKCPNYSKTVARLSTVPLKLLQCINNKIY